MNNLLVAFGSGILALLAVVGLIRRINGKTESI